MDFYSKMAFYFLTCSILVNAAVEACHNAQHAMQEAELTVSGRKRRSVSCANCTADVDESLSIFFTNCLSTKHPGEFPSWRSVVDFVIRDTNWYRATDKDFCSIRKDNAKCWQRRTEYLMQYGSILVNSTKECIGDFDRSVKDQYGPDFEAFHVQNYDMYDYELSVGEFRRSKRSVSDDERYDVRKSATGAQTSNLAEQIAQSCPLYDTASYSQCLSSRYDLTRQSLITDYPSLQFLDLNSNDEFILNHYSSCRIATENIGGNITYRENCPVSSSATANVGSQYNHADIAIATSCLIFDYTGIVSQFSPTFSIYSSCEQQAINERQSSIASLITSLPTPTSVAWTSPSTEYRYENFHVKKRIGSCNKGGKWSSYYNIDSPDGIGDMETLENLQNIFGDQICGNPIAVEVRLSGGESSQSSVGDTVYISPSFGLRCFNSMQIEGICADYKVRFCCHMKETECNGNNSWTKWLDRDRPSRGEDESLQKHLAEGNACPQPVNIKARIKNSRRPYWKGGNVLKISATHGLTCKRNDQIKRRMCKDYQVSFCCPI